MIDTNEILDDIYESTANAFTDGFDTEKILLTQEVYDAFKKENEEVLGVDNGDFDRLFVYPVEINNEIDSYRVVVKEITKEDRLLGYFNGWKHQEQKVREGNGEGFTLEECGRSQDVIRVTLDILGIKIEGIN